MSHLVNSVRNARKTVKWEGDILSVGRTSNRAIGSNYMEGIGNPKKGIGYIESKTEFQEDYSSRTCG